MVKEFSPRTTGFQSLKQQPKDAQGRRLLISFRLGLRQAIFLWAKWKDCAGIGICFFRELGQEIEMERGINVAVRNEIGGVLRNLIV